MPEDVNSPEAFAAWLNGPVGRAWLTDSRKAGRDCYDKLQAIGAIKESWK